MNKSKSQKGITLVALIITIIILLILAVVAIGAVNNTGIIQYAQNSADKYNDEKIKETGILENYLLILKENEDINVAEKIEKIFNEMAMSKAEGNLTEEKRIEYMKELESYGISIKNDVDLYTQVIHIHHRVNGHDEFPYIYLVKLGYAYKMTEKEVNGETIEVLEYVETIEEERSRILLEELLELRDVFTKALKGEKVEDLQNQYIQGTLSEYINTKIGTETNINITKISPGKVENDKILAFSIRMDVPKYFSIFVYAPDGETYSEINPFFHGT